VPTVPFTLETPLGENVFVVLDFKGREILSGLFEYVVVAGTKRPTDLANPDPNPDSLLGQMVTVTCDLGQGGYRYFNGMVAEIAELEPARDMCWYELTLRPKLWLLSLNKRSRIFQSMSATQILKDILSVVGGGLIEVNNPPATRNYCTQYRETDLEFFFRLCSEEGLAHFWIHSRAGHQLVITDNTHSNPSVGPIQYNAVTGTAISIDTIHEWNTRKSIRTGAVGIIDTHFQVFNRVFEGKASVKPAPGDAIPTVNDSPFKAVWQAHDLGTARYFDHLNEAGLDNPDAIPSMYDSAQKRAAALALAAGSQVQVAQGKARSPLLAPGVLFELLGHPSSSGIWIVLEVEHEARQEGVGWTSESPEIRCSTRFRAAPAAVPQKPWPPVARPKVGGVETAIVTGPEGTEARIDQFGRVKVRFWWDSADSNGGNSSCWIRVAQPWAGKGYGAFFWPRVGNEVVVAFEHGDPDRPIIIGSVYNATNITPYTLPEMTYMSGFHSKTEGGNSHDNFHRIVMSDARGSENILIHAESRLLTTQEMAQILRRPKSSIEWQ
jgi:type VI secretion system secreted protein VgrG